MVFLKKCQPCQICLILGGIESTQEGAMTALKGAINSGAALEGFRALVEAQGGDGTVVDNCGRNDVQDGLGDLH